MSESKRHLPPDTQTLTPQLIVRDAGKFADKLVEVFDGNKIAEYPTLDGKGVMWAVVEIGGSRLFLSDVSDFSAPTKANLFVYVPDVDATVAKLGSCGATVLIPPTNMPWGDRWSLLEDMHGNRWQIATNVELLDPAEVRRRMEQAATVAAPPPPA
jgi:PhnB protein